MGKRFLARLIDLIILFVVFLVLFFVMAAVAGTDTADGGFLLTGGAFWLYQVLTWLIWLGYEVGMIAARGATIGKQLIGVKVVREADGQVPGGSPAFLRWLIPFIGSFFCIGGLLVYVSPFFDNTGRRQGWHDKVAKTVVIATK